MRNRDFDVAEAAWVFAADYEQSGFCSIPGDRQRRDIFGRLSRLSFRPRPNLSYDTLTGDAREIYDRWAAMAESTCTHAATQRCGNCVENHPSNTSWSNF